MDADVRMVLNGHPAHLTGTGQDLRVTTDAPADLWTELTRAELPSGIGSVNGPRAIGRVADELDRQGISVAVVGPSGELVRIGARVSSRLGRIVTGSAAVTFGSARTVAPTVLAVVKQSATAVVDRIRSRWRRR
ncbi:MAG: hypothetical protein ABJA16_01520 [Nakamurella sp.]